MAKFEDLTGQKFGMLTVLKRADDFITSSGKRRTRWLCVCDCGGTKEVTATSLKTGQTKSCGCIAHAPTTYNWREFKSARMPEPITIQYRLSIGQTYKINGEKMRLIGLYNGFARFERASGQIECFGYFDLQRWL